MLTNANLTYVNLLTNDLNFNFNSIKLTVLGWSGGADRGSDQEESAQRRLRL